MNDDRIKKAFTIALDAHAGISRKSTSIPYISHPMSVAAIVMEYGEGLDLSSGVVEAALLHDVLEDKQEMTTEALAAEVGDFVAQIVKECSDYWGTDNQKPPWEIRKREYIAHIPDKLSESIFVSMADKVHNLRSILRDKEVHGDEVWLRFKRGPADQKWYFTSLLEAFQREIHSRPLIAHQPLLKEMQRLVGKLFALG
ncbi:MAG: HD domain-containing protein [Bdellovibrionales bacterium]|nr:HD domain-containing protein [Bdellovibrionales bacterium]